MSAGEIIKCPMCNGRGYLAEERRCSWCRAKGKLENGGPPTVYTDRKMIPTTYVGQSGYMLVLVKDAKTGT